MIAYWEGSEQEYIHLVRLAWDLHMVGLRVSLDLGQSGGPCLLVHRAVGPLRVRAALCNGVWWFNWGRSTAHVEALDENAVAVICRAAA